MISSIIHYIWYLPSYSMDYCNDFFYYSLHSYDSSISQFLLVIELLVMDTVHFSRFGLTEVQPDAYDPEQVQCELRLSREVYIGVFAADLILFYMLPLAVAVVVYSKIAWVLMRAGRYCSRDSPCLSLSGAENSSSQPGICGSANAVTDHRRAGSLKTTYSACAIYNALANERCNSSDERREWVLHSRAQVRHTVFTSRAIAAPSQIVHPEKYKNTCVKVGMNAVIIRGKLPFLVFSPSAHD